MEPSTCRGASDPVTGEQAAPVRFRGWLVVSCVAALLGSACTPTTELPAAKKLGGRGRVAHTQGSAVAVTADERVVVATNRTDGIVSILRLDPSRPLDEMVLEDSLTEIAFHPLSSSKPWAAVIGPDDDTAYVLLRGTSQVIEIVGLHGSNPHPSDRHANVGSEPTSILISPTGRQIYVANSADGTVSVILTQDLSSDPLSLNGRLADSGFLGPTARDRLGLAHPRALAITDDGDEDDEDETLYATEFFSQPLADPTVSDPDRNRQGIVYPIDGKGHAPLDAGGREIPFITLAAIETGFNDAEGKPTGCFPNQLYSAASSGNRLFVTSVCASPAGPVESGPTTVPDLASNNFKTLSHPVVFTIDTTTNRAVPEQLVMTRQLADVYPAAEPDARMPLIPSDIVVSADATGRQAFVSSFGASAVFPVHYDQAGAGTIGNSGARYIKLGDSSLPIGMALLSGNRGLLLDDKRRGLGVLDLAESKAVVWVSTIRRDWANDATTKPAEVVDEAARTGRRLFATGLGAWSFSGQAWSSCESCHPEGQSDGVTWRFARGPRRTISLAGTYYGEGENLRRRMLLWTANIDELHDVEAIARQVSGGVGGVVWNYSLEKPGTNCRLIYDGATPAASEGQSACSGQKASTNRLNGLNGSLGDKTAASQADDCGVAQEPCDVNASPDWDKIDAFVRTVRAPRAPSELSTGLVADGRSLFQARACDHCHSGPGWTLSRVFYEPGAAANGAMPSVNPATSDPAYVPDAQEQATLLGALRTRTFEVPPSTPAELAATMPAAKGVAAPFRAWPADPAGGLLAYLYAKPANPDQISCVLRSVGTFGAPQEPDFLGVTPAGAPQVHEVRRTLNMDVYKDTLATGGTGFNIPSLLGVASGAPYFHAGNARTLEEVFAPEFAGHSGLVGAPLTPDEISAMVAFLSSIDDAAAPMPVPNDGFNPDLCAQFTGQ